MAAKKVSTKSAVSFIVNESAIVCLISDFIYEQRYGLGKTKAFMMMTEGRKVCDLGYKKLKTAVMILKEIRKL